jgi:hypothetical protein
MATSVRRRRDQTLALALARFPAAASMRNNDVVGNICLPAWCAASASVTATAAGDATEVRVGGTHVRTYDATGVHER